MITLYQFPPAYGLPNASPFCMKVETYLRMVGLSYRSEYGFNLPKAPKGKLPYIEDSGRLIADSGLILDYLKATYGDPLDVHLSPPERAIALAFVRLLDEHLFWAGCVQPRWVEAAGWQVTRAAFFRGLSWPMSLIVPKVARRNMCLQLYGQGLGRHTTEEIRAMAVADIGALADFLGAKLYFLGERPTSLDAATYAHLANILVPPIDSPVKRHALGCSNLLAYCERMKAVYYADGTG